MLGDTVELNGAAVSCRSMGLETAQSSRIRTRTRPFLRPATPLHSREQIVVLGGELGQ